MTPARISSRLPFSIHALLAESDGFGSAVLILILYFLSTLSLRRATPVCQWRRSLKIFLSTLSLRRATREIDAVRLAGFVFYPRSPCGERPGAACRPHPPLCFSIHALLAESDPGDRYGASYPFCFLSTLSLRRATTHAGFYAPEMAFLSTLSLRRATRAL